MTRPTNVQTVYTGAFDTVAAPYRRAMESAYDHVRFRDGGRARAVLRAQAPFVLHLQWVDPILRHRSPMRSLTHAGSLLALLLAVRLRGQGVVWTCHNPVGKGHRRLRSDRLLRSLVVLLCHRIVVLNEGVVADAAAQLPRPVRARFAARCTVVPLPVFEPERGPLPERAAARLLLGIDADAPVVLWIPGTNQEGEDVVPVDPAGRYAILTRDRAAAREVGVPGVIERDGCLVLPGRANDAEYRALFAAADAMLLPEEHAYGSRRLQDAVQARLPVLAPINPATEELAMLGGLITIPPRPSADDIAAAVGELEAVRPGAFVDFEARHADEVVADRLGEVYRAAGLELIGRPRAG